MANENYVSHWWRNELQIWQEGSLCHLLNWTGMWGIDMKFMTYTYINMDRNKIDIGVGIYTYISYHCLLKGCRTYNNPIVMNTHSIQILVFKYHSVRKGTIILWRNGKFQCWVWKNARWAWDVLFCQKGRAQRIQRNWSIEHRS